MIIVYAIRSVAMNVRLIEDLEAEYTWMRRKVSRLLAGGFIHVLVQYGMVECILHKSVGAAGLVKLIDGLRVLVSPLIHTVAL